MLTSILSSFFQSMPDFKGKRRIARLLFKSSNSQLQVKGKYHLKYNIPNYQESIGLDLLINGIYESNHIKFLSSIINPNGVFIDIGANIGAISLPLARLLPNLTIYSIEASPKVFKYLNTNISQNNLKNIIPINRAINDADADAIPFYSPDGQYGKGSFSAVFTKKPEYIECQRLDEFIAENKIANVDAIKIDVEGYEYQVLKGAKKLLNSAIAPKFIIMEYVDWAERLAKNEKATAQKLLIECGYELYNLHSGKKLAKVIEEGSMMILAKK